MDATQPGGSPERTNNMSGGLNANNAVAGPAGGTSSSLVARWGSKALEALVELGKRIFTHLALLAGGAAVVVLSGDLLAGLCVYVGGICILARGMAAKADWLIPALSGVGQVAVLVLYGVPFAQALFWGGAQSWSQRLLQKDFHMGTEWVVLLLIVPLGIYLLESAPLAPLLVSFAGLAAIGCLARAIVCRQEAAAKAEAAGPPEPKRLVAYRASLAEFNKKTRNLPQNVRVVAESIATRTADILDGMAADSRDLEPGHRFLNRYFKAAHAVVDKHVILAREKITTPEIMESLVRSEEVLGRLDAVFAKEQTRLFENDVADFSADLAVIDTLLKMDRR